MEWRWKRESVWKQRLSRDVSLVISVLHLPAPITAFNRRIGEEEREKGIVEESVREEGMSDRSQPMKRKVQREG
jgi:hypothetical protein